MFIYHTDVKKLCLEDIRTLEDLRKVEGKVYQYTQLTHFKLICKFSETFSTI